MSIKQEARKTHPSELKGCSHGKIATAIAILLQQMGCVGCNVSVPSHGAIATVTLNPIQTISCEKLTACAIVPYEQPKGPLTRCD